MSSKPKLEVSRRDVLRGLGAAGLALPLSTLGHHPLVPVPTGQAWAPRLLDEARIETLLALAEQIIPETDTPGARGALVHQYIDYVVSEDTLARQEALLDALSWFDERSRVAFGAAYAAAEPSRQQRLVEEAATDASAPGHGHFTLVKQLTVEGYYRSEIGMVQELGYRGKMVLSEFDGCEHSEHHAFEPRHPEANPGDA